MTECISSMTNKLIKETTSLKQRKYREKLELFLAEGVRLVEECVHADWPVATCIYTEEIAERERAKNIIDRLAVTNCRMVKVPAEIYKKISDTEQPQGIMAILKKRQFSVKQMLAGKDKLPLLVILDGIQDPGNVGTIIRTADAAGCSGVITLKGSADIYAGKTVRATMGSLFHLPVAEGMIYSDLITNLKQAGVSLLATCLQHSAVYYQADFKRPVALILGNEGQGISPELLSAADSRINIPLIGHAESLNVAVAAGVVLYEAIRQRATL
ncbi:TrmH family RNA methyltransferase [Sporomusa acidovorans]|uniref:23S rRNA (Uridine(2479)-2'-O)-methyltransferase n=1 Tax=Sporomusa acidovorans (strain ATCC 49682 / DSM 3132 / Mol) TaxID=1123286 RepID=A0ABZ3J3K4_SPOA4|nr:RNA methyltransferase [Sporomusa acidovorans]OZC20918.1 23S rRNA (uridine(2479)-2'-O)-methyltransferase [Sporomusa acidovorans DSM 3132]SDE61012.1 RNA methyltransferase, TrmH family [Sporomusa acidovorans]